MGKPAARAGDMHVCPMVDGVKPHVGGPVTPLGVVTTVLIAGAPAAVLGTMCQCVGPPDKIIMGSPVVLIGGKAAARMGDMTVHGGSIILGAPTVLIGDAGSGSGSGDGSGGGSDMYGKVGADQAKDMANRDALKDAAKDGSKNAERSDKKDFTAQFSLVDEAGKGRAGQRYEIRTSDGQVHSGKTGNDGKTEQLSGYTIADCTTTFFNN